MEHVELIHQVRAHCHPLQWLWPFLHSYTFLDNVGKMLSLLSFSLWFFIIDYQRNYGFPEILLDMFKIREHGGWQDRDFIT